MTTTRADVEGLVVRIQGEFLGEPALRLTLDEAARRFDVSGGHCEAVLHALVDARVLAVTPAGSYERLYPRGGGRTNGSHFWAA